MSGMSSKVLFSGHHSNLNVSLVLVFWGWFPCKVVSGLQFDQVVWSVGDCAVVGISVHIYIRVKEMSQKL